MSNEVQCLSFFMINMINMINQLIYTGILIHYKLYEHVYFL